MARALPLLGETFFVVNSDVFWLDGKDHALARLAAAFDPEPMDAVLLFHRTATAVGYEGAATIFSTRSAPRAGAASARSRRICSPASSCCTAAPSTASPSTRFSLNLVYDRAEAAGALRAILHDGEWYHVGTPDGLAMTRARLSSHRIER